MNRFNFKFFFIAALFLGIFLTQGAMAANVGEVINFSIDQGHDVSARTQVQSALIKTSAKLYFYVEKNWWNSQLPAKQNEIYDNLDALSKEFENKIYPILTSVFGQEWKPGVDGDDKITILFHSMKDESSGYFRSADEFVKLQLPDSNEKEMLYLPISQIGSSRLKVFLAHEFVHLITFNQKERPFDVSEEVWLNEARADYSSTILGYDEPYGGSNLQGRVKTFLEKPSDSLTEWLDTKYDYASVSVFTHYLVDQYGINTLTDSLKSKLIGIPSINYALSRIGEKDDFSQIFTNWTIAMAVNDCSLGKRYCYLNTNLENLRINPTLNFLPLVGSSSLSVSNVTKNWSANWQKIIGGDGDLKLNFSSLFGLNFQVPYIIADKNGNYSVKFLKLDKNESGEIDIPKFGSGTTSLVIIPSLQTKLSGFDGAEFTYPFTFTVSIKEEPVSEDATLIQKLLAQIEALKKQIAELQGRSQAQCSQISSNLYFGMSNNGEVRCLQEFLKLQGVEIYSEGLVTGNFGNLTKSAVARFQEKYKSEILTPLGLKSGTGFVGSSTRQKINQLL